MQCAVTHRKEKEHKNFPPVLGSQDNVHSKQHLGSLLRALRCALFLSSCTCSKNVIFQGKGTREKGSEASAFCCSCTLYLLLKQAAPGKSCTCAQVSTLLLHICTSSQHCYLSLQLGKGMISPTSPSLPFLQFFCGRICFKK